jgi:GntR family carbon starvation induced transcriptional regulator
VIARSSEPGSLTGAIYLRIRHDILTGALPPGQKLRIEGLCARYDVGSSPIREALSRLSAEQIVVQSDRRGFHAAPVSTDELEELTRTRCWVNEITMREAIAHGDEAWEERIVIALHRLERMPTGEVAGSDADSQEREERHREFHAALIASCPSTPLLDFSQALFDRADRYRSLTRRRSPAQPRDTRSEHRAIMDATIARDTPTAIRLLNEHATRTATDVSVIAAVLRATNAPGDNKLTTRH